MCCFIFFHPRPSRTKTVFSWPGSALRHREVANRPEVAESLDARTCPQKTADIDGWAPRATRRVNTDFAQSEKFEGKMCGKIHMGSG